MQYVCFPLENAFINLSDDIVVNLITVALTRAKEKIIITGYDINNKINQKTWYGLINEYFTKIN